MKKDSTAAPFNAQHYLDEESILSWISKYGQTLFYASLALIAILFIIYRLSSHQSASLETDFLTAATRYEQVIGDKNPARREEALKELLAILERRPELNADYEGNIAQILLEQHQVNLALPLATETIKRVSSTQLTDYLNYSATTLLIEQKKYQEALTASISLKEQLKDNDLVNALNLVRIALLQQELGDRDGEIVAWNEWKKFAGWKGIAPEAKTLDPKIYFVVQNYYGQGSLSLANYIEKRMENK